MATTVPLACRKLASIKSPHVLLQHRHSPVINSALLFLRYDYYLRKFIDEAEALLSSLDPKVFDLQSTTHIALVFGASPSRASEIYHVTCSTIPGAAGVSCVLVTHHL